MVGKANMPSNMIANPKEKVDQLLRLRAKRNSRASEEEMRTSLNEMVDGEPSPQRLGANH